MSIEFKCEQKDISGNITTTITYVMHDGADGCIHNVMQEFRRFLLAVSFTPETVDEYIEGE